MTLVKLNETNSLVELAGDRDGQGNSTHLDGTNAQRIVKLNIYLSWATLL